MRELLAISIVRYTYSGSCNERFRLWDLYMHDIYLIRNPNHLHVMKLDLLPYVMIPCPK